MKERKFKQWMFFHVIMCGLVIPITGFSSIEELIRQNAHYYNYIIDIVCLIYIPLIYYSYCKFHDKYFGAYCKFYLPANIYVRNFCHPSVQKFNYIFLYITLATILIFFPFTRRLHEYLFVGFTSLFFSSFRLIESYLICRDKRFINFVEDRDNMD